jgi:peptidyl-prolyl cis-trans isomerase C
MLCWPPAKRLELAILMQKRISFTIRLAPILVTTALIVAGCGGGGGKAAAGLGGDDVAVVGSQHIPKTDFDAILAEAKASYKQQKRTFPKEGTTEYESVKAQVMKILVEQAERADKAASMGIHVTSKQVAARLAKVKKQYFGGSEKRYRAQLSKQHLTDAYVRKSIRNQLISEALIKQLTKGTKVSSDEVHSYYLQHPELYSQPQSREARYILVKSKPLADQLYRQLRNASDKTWCTLVKKYTKDPSSKTTCGKPPTPFSKGQTVPEFDKVLFSAPTKQVHPPIHNKTYGWFVIEPLAAVHPRKTTPEKQVAATIKQQLISQKNTQIETDWANNLAKGYCSDSRIKYQVGYKPNPDPCTSVTTSTTTPTVATTG